MAPNVLLYTGLLLLGLAATNCTASTDADVHPPEPPASPCTQALETRCSSDQHCNCMMPEKAEEAGAAPAQQNFYHRLLMLLELLRHQN